MNAEDLDFLLDLVRTRTGLVLHGDKIYFAQSRLGPLARREGAASVETLLTSLRQGRDPRLAQAAVEAMTIADTAFFRDPDVFEHIRDEVLPGIYAERPDGVVTVWSAGCSTGQEAYSMAMLAEQARATLPGLRLDIVGTDLSRRALEKAHSGLYTQFEVQRGLPIRLMLEHFEKCDDMWRVSETLRASVRWRQLNLLDERRSVRPFDVILCRNVVGHMDAEIAGRVVEQIAGSLAIDGCLVLGAGETAETPSLKAADSAMGVFRRARFAGRAAA